jgi:3-oxoacyl-[acyl-carrier protein] reductase
VGEQLGGASALSLAAQGTRVTLVDVDERSLAAVAQTAERVREAGSEPVLLQADIAEWSQVVTLADAAFNQLGGVDVLINNVGDHLYSILGT